ncbi:MAG: C25 family cysteine peptidase [Pseudomonadota bacterium]
MKHSIMNMLSKSAHALLPAGLIKASLLLALLAYSGTSYAQTALVNLVASEPGMHRITYQELADQGVDLANVLHRRLSLKHAGQAVPIYTKGQTNGRRKYFGPGGYIEFYAEPVDSLYTDSRAYTLHYDRASRVNFATQKNRYSNNQAAATEYQQTKVYDGNVYYDFLSPSKTDPWHYGQVFGGGVDDVPGTEVNFELDGLSGASTELDVEVYGIVDLPVAGNDHHFVAKVNDVEVGDQQFDGNVASTLSINSVPVAAGSNKFQIFIRSIATTPFDAFGLNKLTFRYMRSSHTSDDYVEGYFDSNQANVSGLTNNGAFVYRLEPGGGITRITGTKKVAADTLGFNTAGVAGNYVVAAPDGYKSPAVAMLPNEVDITSVEAEYLIITHDSFIGSDLTDLVNLRNGDYSVNVVDVAQIYAQFGNYLPSAESIRDYIRFAANNLGTRFVVLVGSDSYDYKNYASAAISFIPTRYEVTPGDELIVQQTPSDASYGDTDLDGVQDVHVGRISVRTPTELGYVVEKIRDFEARAAAARPNNAGEVLIAADEADNGNNITFIDDVAALINAMPDDWGDVIPDAYKALPDFDGGPAAHDKVIDGINSGPLVTAYIGHSSQQQWSRTTPPLFVASEIASLTNIDRPTLVTQWGCWNTYFVDPAGNSMADQFLSGGLQGAVTVLGASSLTTSEGERLLGIELSKRMFNPGMTIGEAVTQAKQALAATNPEATDIILGWQILGDPALVINPE